MDQGSAPNWCMAKGRAQAPTEIHQTDSAHHYNSVGNASTSRHRVVRTVCNLPSSLAHICLLTCADIVTLCRNNFKLRPCMRRDVFHEYCVLQLKRPSRRIRRNPCALHLQSWLRCPTGRCKKLASALAVLVALSNWQMQERALPTIMEHK